MVCCAQNMSSKTCPERVNVHILPKDERENIKYMVCCTRLQRPWPEGLTHVDLTTQREEQNIPPSVI